MREKFQTFVRIIAILTSIVAGPATGRLHAQGGYDYISVTLAGPNDGRISGDPVVIRSPDGETEIAYLIAISSPTPTNFIVINKEIDDGIPPTNAVEIARVDSVSFRIDEIAANSSTNIVVLKNEGATRSLGLIDPFTGAFVPYVEGLTATVDRVSLNDSGQAAFAGTPAGGLPGIYLAEPGKPLKTIADNAGPIKTVYGPSLNNRGDISFSAFLDDNTLAIYRYSGGLITTVADTKGSFFGFGADIMNQNGSIAFRAIVGGFGNETIYRADGAILTPLADTFGPFLVFDDPSLNGLGRIAFTARLDSGDRAVFTGGDAVADRVIGVGDALAGSTITEVSMGRHAFTDEGDIVFKATLANDKQGVFHARPRREIKKAERRAGGVIHLEGIGVPDQFHEVQATSSLTTPFQTIGTVKAGAHGEIRYDDSTAGSYETRFYRWQRTFNF